MIYGGRRLRVGYRGLLGGILLGCLALWGVFGIDCDKKAEAASMAGFNAGYIISDYQMGNYNSMSEADIQAFLTSKNSCSNRDYGYFQQLSGNTKYQWHWDNGHFVCLSEERFGYNDNEIGYGESAAHIIWQAAQDYRINPQALIVLLQKETGLITDPIPNNGDYRKATGYGCPDTAACSSQYYGFRNQIRNAAALYRYVLDNGSRYYPVGDNYVQYNPNAGCGGTVVNILNRATSALYQYTPYQPNWAALNAGYGVGDSCSAYGNRNFYAYFEDWFGGITKERSEPTIEEIMLNMTRPASEESDIDLVYNMHVANYGWLSPVSSGEMSGTTGYSIRGEAFSAVLEDGMSGLEYRVHMQDIGWENTYKRDGEIAGTTGQSRRMEAIQMRLSDELVNDYDIYYRAHVANIGWMDWVKNGEIAGTTGQSRRLEALQIKIIRKSTSLGVISLVHSADIGWMNWVKYGRIVGTTGQSRRMEAIALKLVGDARGGNIRYRVYTAEHGWMDWVGNDTIAGTTGQSRQMEAIQIQLTDGLEEYYDIYYRAHVANIGWMDWVKNGEIAGTINESRRMEALQVKLVRK